MDSIQAGDGLLLETGQADFNSTRMDCEQSSVCMYVCMYVSVQGLKCMYIYISRPVKILSLCMYVCMYVLYVSVNVCMYVCTKGINI